MEEGGGNERGETMVFTVYIPMEYDQIINKLSLR